MKEYIVMKGRSRFTSPMKWDVCVAFGPRNPRGRGVVTISRHRTKPEAVAECSRLNKLLQPEAKP